LGKLHVFALNTACLTLSIHGARVRLLPKLLELLVHGKESALLILFHQSHGKLFVLARDAARVLLAVDQRRVFLRRVPRCNSGRSGAAAFLARARRRGKQRL
jgi:hypothetical protein